MNEPTKALVSADWWDDVVEDFMFSTNARFIATMTRLVEALERTEIPWHKIRRVQSLPGP